MTEVTEVMKRALWDLMEMEAVEKYYINSAEKPGITINTGFMRAPNAKPNENYTVYFGSGIAHYNFKSLKKARQKAEEILNTAKKPLKVRVVDRDNLLLRFITVEFVEATP